MKYTAFIILMFAAIAGCKKDVVEPTQKEIIQEMLVGRYDMTCLRVSWVMPNPQYDTIYSTETWSITKAEDSTNIYINGDKLLTSTEEYKYYLGGYNWMSLDFFAPDSISSMEDKHAGMMAGGYKQCSGRKQ